MRQSRKRIILLILLASAILLLRFSGIGEHLTFENLKANRDVLKGFVISHYVFAVLVYIALYISTVFFIPGAIVLTIAWGAPFWHISGKGLCMHRGNHRSNTGIFLRKVSNR